MRLTVRPFSGGFAAAAAMTLVLVSATVSPASAQTATTDRVDPPSTEKRLALTPFVAMGDDVAPGGGAALTFEWTRRVSLEAEASVGADASRTSLSLLFHLPQLGRVATYVAGGGGIQSDEQESLVPGIGVISRRATEFAVNVGGGVTVPVSARWAWRADFRWYNPSAEWPESWRVYNGLSLNLRH